ncbi:lamin tail domain-containing protein [Candidatus Poribacteria bacterium]|nr:lamin tail domain-containing protein [Candidatus Poribacteria bacterium]
MDKRVLLMVTLLLLCALISLQQAAVATIIEVVGRSTQRTVTTDTDDITFTVRFTGESGENRAFALEAGGLRTNTNPLLVTVGLSTEALFVRGGRSYDVTVTVARSQIPTARDTINITLAGVDVLETSYVFQVSLTIAVRLPTDPVADISLGIDGTGTKSVSPSEIEDVIFTLTLDNDGNTSDTVSVAVIVDELSFYDGLDVDDETIQADLALLALSSTSVTVAPDVQSTLTLTIPASLIETYSRYSATVRATSGTDSDFTSTIKVSVNVRAMTSSIVLEGLGALTQTSNTSDTDDITYTLRVTNTGDSLDALEFSMLSDSIDTATLDQTELTLFPDSYEDIILTIPRTALSEPGTYQITVVAESHNDSSVIVNVVTETIITGEAPSETDETDEDGEDGEEDENGGAEGDSETGGTDETDETQTEQATYRVILSEFMFEAGGDESGLPQWIEVYNNGSTEVNLSGWKLLWKSLQPAPLELTFAFDKEFRIPPEQARLIVTALGRHSGGGNLSDDAVYQLPLLYSVGLEQEMIVSRFQSITGGGFSLKLTNSQDTLVDEIATLIGNEKTWDLPETLIEGVRSSLIRRFDEKVPRAGTERRGWIRAVDTKNLIAGIYYGSPQDLGTPGYRRGKPLPVELSHFSAKFVTDEVVISWTTESELNNAGFDIFRSTSRNKNFQHINPKLIQGAGTTGQRTHYQFIDKTAKPEVVYYYRLEDVDLTGTRGIQTTVRLRGVIAPTGKHLITWGTLKGNR